MLITHNITPYLKDYGKMNIGSINKKYNIQKSKITPSLKESGKIDVKSRRDLSSPLLF